MTAVGLVTAVVAGGFAPHIPLTGGFVVEFQDMRSLPDGNFQMQMSVTVDGHTKAYAPGIGIGVNNGNGDPAEKFAEFMTRSIAHDDPGWVYRRRDGQLLIRGWTDPADGRFYPVKGVTFTTDPANDPTPEKCMPKVRDRRPKG